MTNREAAARVRSLTTGEPAAIPVRRKAYAGHLARCTGVG